MEDERTLTVNERIDMLNLKLDVILKEISLLRGDQRLFHEDIGLSLIHISEPTRP